MGRKKKRDFKEEIETFGHTVGGGGRVGECGRAVNRFSPFLRLLEPEKKEKKHKVVKREARGSISGVYHPN